MWSLSGPRLSWAFRLLLQRERAGLDVLMFVNSVDEVVMVNTDTERC